MARIKKQISWELPHEIRLPTAPTRFLYFFYKNIDDSKSAKRLKQLKINKDLYKKALQGDASAFQQLVSNDPRYLCSNLGLYFITRWRNTLVFSHFGIDSARLDFECFQSQVDKLGPLSPTLPDKLKNELGLHAHNKSLIKERAQWARQNLNQISRSLLSSFDGRGLRGIPPGDQIRPFYYAASELFSSLKTAVRGEHLQTKEKRIDRFLEEFSRIQDCQIQLKDPSDDLLIYVRFVASAWINWGGQSSDFRPIYIGMTSPSELAARFCGKLFGLNERTIQKYANSKKYKIFQPANQLEDYQLAVDILRIK